MNKWVTVIIVFALGIMFGFLVSYSFNTSTVSGNGNLPKADPYAYGDIKIVPYVSLADVAETSGGYSGISISNKEVSLELHFDDEEELKDIYLYNKANQDHVVPTRIMNYSVDDANKRPLSVIYGGGYDYSWHDWNCDGIFDVQFNESMAEIMVDGQWIKAAEWGGINGGATVIEGEREIHYQFDFEEDKWLAETGELGVVK